jgi:anti-anti-sigma factor
MLLRQCDRGISCNEEYFMAFDISASTTDRGAEITLSGELDAASAPVLQAELEKVAQQKPNRLILLVKDLEFIASAGVRMLVFAKQKLGRTVDVYIIAPQQQIVDTLERTGLLNSFIVQDEFQPE